MEPEANDPPEQGDIVPASDGERSGPPGGSSPTDGQLVAQVLEGQREAFDELIHRYQRQAVAVSYRLLGNSNDALEVTQDAFFKAFRNIATLQKPDAFGGWLMRIVSNLSLNFRRGRRTRLALPLDDLLGPSSGEQSEAQMAGSEWMARSGDPSQAMESAELGKHLQEALMQLPEKQRQAIVLFTIDELPQKEVAEALKCSVEAVKWHVFQGRKKLREILKEHLQDGD